MILCTSNRRQTPVRLGGPGAHRLAAPLVVAAAFLISSSTSLAQSLRIWSTGVVTEPHVRMEDVCELGALPDVQGAEWKKLVIQAAPPLGASATVSMDAIRAALLKAGANIATLRLMGALACEVTRVAPSSYDVGADGISTQPPMADPGAGPDPHEKASTNGEPGTLREVIQAWLDAELAVNGARAILTFRDRDRAAVALKGGRESFRLLERSGPRLGGVRLRIEVVGDQPDKTQPRLDLVVQVAASIPVAVAKNILNQNTVVERTDVEIRPLTFSSWPEGMAFSVEDVVGRQVGRFYAPGDPIAIRDLKVIPVVQRNQWVRIITQAGEVRLEMAGKAVGAGSIGDVVQVRLARDQELEALVTGPGEVTAIGK